MHAAIREADRQLLKHELGEQELLSVMRYPTAQYDALLAHTFPLDPTDEVPGESKPVAPNSETGG